MSVDSGRLVVPFLTLYLGVHRGIPASQAALVVSLFGAGSFIWQMVGGALSDRWGRRPVMLISFLGAAVAPVVAGSLAGASYLLPFILDGATTLAFGLIVLFAFRETRPEQAATHAAGVALR